MGENMGQMLSPEFGDLDGDGDKDLLVGDFNGFIQYFQNNGSNSSLSFTFVENVGNIDLSGNSVPALGDLDSDGDLDLLIGQLNGELAFYRNIGTSSNYNFQQESFSEIEVGSNSAPELIDKDNDGDLDLILGSGSEGLYYYWNNSASNYYFQLSSDWEFPVVGLNSKPTLGELYDSGTIEIITGLSTGGIYHIQTEVCPALGDMNGDNGYNVLDIVTLANCVLGNNCMDQIYSCAGDMNSDGGYNVLDIVALANCVLENNCSN
jgi:hypothetical protein